MSHKQIGYLYILSNEFSSDEMITLSSSALPPDKFLEGHRQNSQGDKISHIPLDEFRSSPQILYSIPHHDYSKIESYLHRFLISRGFSGGGPKDYQIKLQDSILLLRTICQEENIYKFKEGSELIHTKVFPEEACNYHLLGHFFNGTYFTTPISFSPEKGPDFSVAFECFYRGALLDQESCKQELIRYYEFGIGIPQNYKKALDYAGQIYTFNPLLGISAMFRIYLKQEKNLRALAIFKEFVDICDGNIPFEMMASSTHKNDMVGDVLEHHHLFVASLAEIIIDCYQICGDWDLLSDYMWIFEDFSYSIRSHIHQEIFFYEENKLIEKSDMLKKCLVEFDLFIQSGLKSSA